ncbi:MAG: ATP-binding cassette domain-containing protein, partial [Clostridiaceae bacterium]
MSIKTEHLTYEYSPGTPFATKALDDISMEIPEGKFVAIIGHTGSGKSTLIQHFNGLIMPTSGKVYIGDLDITAPGVNLTEVRKRVGLVFQYPEYQLFEETIEKDVAFGPSNLGLEEEEIKNRVKLSMEAVGLDYE